MPFSLRIYLPKNRWNNGIARLFGPDGTLVMGAIPCRGKADSGKAKRAGNPERDPTRPWGDTPSGEYKPVPITLFVPPHPTLGRDVILLEGISGQALEAKTNGRTGLAVHANRGNERLVATYGCVRVFDRDMEAMTEAIGDDMVAVEVIDGAAPPIEGKD